VDEKSGKEKGVLQGLVQNANWELPDKSNLWKLG